MTSAAAHRRYNQSAKGRERCRRYREAHRAEIRERDRLGGQHWTARRTRELVAQRERLLSEQVSLVAELAAVVDAIVQGGPGA